MKPLVQIKYFGPTQITWILNQSCPFHCWYCPDFIHKGRNNTFDWETCNKFLDFLFEKYPYANISMSGGEPTTWPYFEKLVDKVAESGKKIYIGVNSNLIRTREWWTRMAPKLTGVSASYHPSVIKTEEERADWFDKLEMISQLTETNLRVMMDPGHWDHCIDVVEKIKNRDDTTFGVEPVRLLNYFEGFDLVNYNIDYTPEQDQMLPGLDFIPAKVVPEVVKAKQYPQINRFVFEGGQQQRAEHFAPVVLNKVNQFKGWKCNIGLESLYISPDGLIKRGNCFEGGIIGNILEPENIKWATGPIECTYDVCHCFTDIRITKWKVK